MRAANIVVRGSKKTKPVVHLGLQQWRLRLQRSAQTLILQPSGDYHIPKSDGQSPSRRSILVLFHTDPKKVGKVMSVLLMVLVLVFITVAPPFAVMATAKAKSRRR
jgi:hypothetical protein